MRSQRSKPPAPRLDERRYPPPLDVPATTNSREYGRPASVRRGATESAFGAGSSQTTIVKRGDCFQERVLPGVASSRHHRGPYRSTVPLRSSHLRGTVASMTDDRIWTAAELEQLSPDERDRIVKEGIVTDLSQVPADFLARARAKGRALLEERGVITTDGS